MIRAPLPATGFVGRQGELAMLDDLLAAGHRVVTLRGPPGIGKTRLAFEYAHRQRERYARRGGAWICDLTEVRDLEGVSAAVAAAMGLPPVAAPAGLAQHVGEALASRGTALLVLDSFEHLVEHAAATLARWLRAAPDLRVIVTSRTRLRLAAELAFEVPPLTVPEPGADPGAADAVRLFVERVRALRPDYQLTADEAPTVVSLVRRLEGVPLSIELAAARMDILGAGELLERLEHRLDVLVGGPRDAGPRHRSLRGAIEWSWHLLDPDEQSALAQCSVFRGGFSLTAAEAIVRPPGNADALDLLAALRDKSLLSTWRAPEDPRASRFRLLESIREFAEERLGEAEVEARREVHARHARYYLELAEAAAEALDRRGARDAADRLALEQQNVRAVIERAQTPEQALRAVLALAPLALVRGPFDPFRDLLDRTLAETGPAAEALRLRAVWMRGRLEQVCGRHDEAERDLGAALERARSAGMLGLEAAALTDLGVLHHQRRQMERASDHYAAALALHRTLGDRRAEGRALGNLGALHHDERHYDAARARYLEALATFREVDDRRLEGIFLGNLGILEQECGDLAAAEMHTGRAAALLEQVDRRLWAITQSNRGILRHEQGALADALACHERALGELRALGDRRSWGLCLGRIAAIEAMRGAPDDAQARLDAAERLLEPLHDPTSVAAARFNEAFVDLARSRQAWAEGHGDASERHLAAVRERIQAARSPGDTPPLVARSDDVRASMRLLERALDEGGPPLLEIGPGATWFRAPAGEVVELHRHQAPRLILLELVRQRDAAPGAELAMERLAEAGWPGVRIASEASANRVYVAVATLRRFGLKPFVESRAGGYLIPPEIGVRRSTRSLA